MSSARRALTALVGFALTIVGLIGAAPSVLAQLPPDLPGSGETVQPPPLPTVAHVSYGSPIWVFILVAAVASALTLAAMLAPKLGHQRHARRQRRPQASHA